jgi:hypothetical protein
MNGWRGLNMLSNQEKSTVPNKNALLWLLAYSPKSRRVQLRFSPDIFLIRWFSNSADGRGTKGSPKRNNRDGGLLHIYLLLTRPKLQQDSRYEGGYAPMDPPILNAYPRDRTRFHFAHSCGYCVN